MQNCYTDIRGDTLLVLTPISRVRRDRDLAIPPHAPGRRKTIREVGARLVQRRRPSLRRPRAGVNITGNIALASLVVFSCTFWSGVMSEADGLPPRKWRPRDDLMMVSVCFRVEVRDVSPPVVYTSPKPRLLAAQPPTTIICLTRWHVGISTKICPTSEAMRYSKRANTT